MKAIMVGSVVCSECSYTLIVDTWSTPMSVRCVNDECKEYDVRYQVPALELEKVVGEGQGTQT